MARHESIYRKTTKTLKKIEQFEWKHKNLILIAISVILAYYIVKTTDIASFILSLGNLGYPAAFFLGIIFPHAFITAPAAIAFFELGKFLNPFALASIGAAGAVISDYLIFRFVRDRLVDEIKSLAKEMKGLPEPRLWKKVQHRIWHGILKSRIWHFLVPFLAGLIIALPLPDEIGVAIFGAVRFDPKKFVIVAYILHFIGILIVAYSHKVI